MRFWNGNGGREGVGRPLVGPGHLPGQRAWPSVLGAASAGFRPLNRILPAVNKTEK